MNTNPITIENFPFDDTYYISRKKDYEGEKPWDDSEYLHKNFQWHESTVKPGTEREYNAYFGTKKGAERFLALYRILAKLRLVQR